jgi:hypothetical protein
MTRKKRRLKRLENETVSFRILLEVTWELTKQTRSGRNKEGIKRSGYVIGDATNQRRSLVRFSASVNAFPMEFGPWLVRIVDVNTFKIVLFPAFY